MSFIEVVDVQTGRPQDFTGFVMRDEGNGKLLATRLARCRIEPPGRVRRLRRMSPFLTTDLSHFADRIGMVGEQANDDMPWNT